MGSTATEPAAADHPLKLSAKRRRTTRFLPNTLLHPSASTRMTTGQSSVSSFHWRMSTLWSSSICRVTCRSVPMPPPYSRICLSSSRPAILSLNQSLFASSRLRSLSLSRARGALNIGLTSASNVTGRRSTKYMSLPAPEIYSYNMSVCSIPTQRIDRGGSKPWRKTSTNNVAGRDGINRGVWTPPVPAIKFRT